MIGKLSVHRVDLLKEFMSHPVLRDKLEAQDKNVIFNNVAIQVKPYEQMQDHFDILDYCLDDLTEETIKQVIDHVSVKLDDEDDEIKYSTCFMLKKILKNECLEDRFKLTELYGDLTRKNQDFFKHRNSNLRNQFYQAVQSLDVETVKRLFVEKNYGMFLFAMKSSREDFIVWKENFVSALHATLTHDSNEENKNLG